MSEETSLVRVSAPVKTRLEGVKRDRESALKILFAAQGFRAPAVSFDDAIKFLLDERDERLAEDQ